MTCKDFKALIRKTPYTSFNYTLAIMWVPAERLPVKVVSLEDKSLKTVNIPDRIENKYGNIVPVTAVSPAAFADQTELETIVLPRGIREISAGTFNGCTGLKRIFIPKAVRFIDYGAFQECNSLEDVYFEGTQEDWKRIDIMCEKHEVELGDLIPGSPVQEIIDDRTVPVDGNVALFKATVHFNCSLPDREDDPPCGIYKIICGGKDISGLLKTI